MERTVVVDDRPCLVHGAVYSTIVSHFPTRSSPAPINFTTPVPVGAAAYHAVVRPCLVSSGACVVVVLPRCHVLEWCSTSNILLCFCPTTGQ